MNLRLYSRDTSKKKSDMAVRGFLVRELLSASKPQQTLNQLGLGQDLLDWVPRWRYSSWV